MSNRITRRLIPDLNHLLLQDGLLVLEKGGDGKKQEKAQVLNLKKKFDKLLIFKYLIFLNLGHNDFGCVDYIDFFCSFQIFLRLLQLLRCI